MTAIVTPFVSDKAHDFTRGALLTEAGKRYAARRPALTDDQLRGIAPSVFASEPWEGMSDRYEFIPTSGIVQALREAGFAPVDAMQSRSRIEGKGDYTRHMVRFRPVSSDWQVQAVGDTFPEFALVNSHDGASGFSLMGAMYRLLCNNGLIVSAGTLQSISVRHTGTGLADDVIEGTGTLIREVPNVLAQIERMRAAHMEQPHVAAFADAALALRWGEGEHRPIDVDAVARARRQDDAHRNLWTVLNVIQENLIQGGVRGRNANGKRYTTRAVGGVAENVKLNRDLWALGDEALALLA